MNFHYPYIQSQAYFFKTNAYFIYILRRALLGWNKTKWKGGLMFEDNSKVRTLAALCELNAIKSPVHKCEFQIFNINRAQWEEINIAPVFRNTP